MAVFIDLENMFGGYNKGVSGVPLSRMLREIRKLVRDLEIGSSAATTKAYANWMVAGMSTYRREMLEEAVEPVQIFSYTGSGKTPEESRKKNLEEGRRKNAADVQIVVDALSVAVEAPWVDVFVIVSGDGDFIPLVRRLQYLGKYVIGVTLTGAGAGGVSALLRSNADHYFEVAAGAPRPAAESALLTAESAVETPSEPSAAQLPSDKIPTVEEYVQSIKEIVLKNPKMMKGNDVNGPLLGNSLRTQWPRATYSTYGFKSLGDLVESKCGLTIYRPIAKSSVTKSTQGVEKTLLPSTSIAVPNEDSLRLALEGVEPAVVYPMLTSIYSVLEELTVVFSPVQPDALLDTLGDDLPDVPAEQIRLALGLLFAVGAFRVDDDSALMLTSDLTGVEDGIALVLGDARRRAETIELVPSDDDIRAALFGLE